MDSENYLIQSSSGLSKIAHVAFFSIELFRPQRFGERLLGRRSRTV